MCLDWGMDVWGFEGVDWRSGCVRMWEESVKKVRLFGLGYVRMNVWGKFMGVCEWCDGYERILIFFKGVKCYFTYLSLPIKFF